MIWYGTISLFLSTLGSFTAPTTAEANALMSENVDPRLIEPALPPLILPSASSTPSSHVPSLNNDPAKEYSVFPKNPSRIDHIKELIKPFAVGDIHTQLSQNRPEMKGVLYWAFEITESKVQSLRQALGHDAVVENKPAGRRQEEIPVLNTSLPLNVTKIILPENNFVPQHDAPEDLKVVSWPSGRPLASLKNYVYDDEWQVDPTTYVIDSGVNKMNRDFSLGINNWLYSDKTYEKGIATEDDSDPDLHGSCVASKAVGLANGVYKRSNLAVVKIDPSITIREFVWAFDNVLTDITSGGRVKPAVVIFPVVSEDDPDEAAWDEVKNSMQLIIDRGGSIVVSAGNLRSGNQRQDVDTFPALWAENTFPIIVAGAVNNVGVPWSGSQGGPHVTTWAPGVQVRCAARRSAYRKATGTSVASGMVGGLVAYGLALGRVRFDSNSNTPRNVRTWLLNHARWPREQDGLNVIWNEVQGF